MELIILTLCVLYIIGNAALAIILGTQMIEDSTFAIFEGDIKVKHLFFIFILPAIITAYLFALFLYSAYYIIVFICYIIDNGQSWLDKPIFKRKGDKNNG